MNLPVSLLVALQICAALFGRQIRIDNSWRGIKIFESAKTDVERAFGAPNNGPEGAYSFPEFSVNLTYSKGACKEGWNVQQGAVIKIIVSLKKDRPKISDMGILLGQFVMEKDKELPDISYYVSKRDGVTVVAIGGEMRQLFFYPSDEDEKKMKCEK